MTITMEKVIFQDDGKTDVIVLHRCVALRFKLKIHDHKGKPCEGLTKFHTETNQKLPFKNKGYHYPY